MTAPRAHSVLLIASLLPADARLHRRQRDPLLRDHEPDSFPNEYER
jgi:hypothetical protein